MEIVVGAAVVTTVCIAAGYVTLTGAGAAAQVMTHMFDSPARLGWPSGVQEDDDFRWRWSGRRDPEDSEPEFVELTDGGGAQAGPVARH